jgi:MoxR-like ATPase
LRRCIYYNIPFPDRPRLSRIIAARVGQFAGKSDGFLADALDLFERLRDPAAGLRKKPATAEILAWLVTLRALHPESENPLVDDPAAAARTVSSLVKTAEDQELARAVVERWQKDRPR